MNSNMLHYERSNLTLIFCFLSKPSQPMISRAITQYDDKVSRAFFKSASQEGFLLAKSQGRFNLITVLFLYHYEMREEKKRMFFFIE